MQSDKLRTWGRAPALWRIHQTSGGPHISHLARISQGGAADDQSRAVGQTDIRPSCCRPRLHGVTGLALWTDRQLSSDYYPVKETRTPEEAARGGRRSTCHPWQAGRLQIEKPARCLSYRWLARAASQVLRSVPGRVPGRRGGRLEARWLRGLRGRGHGRLNRLFAPDA
jgi:hypothetical protein